MVIRIIVSKIDFDRKRGAESNRLEVPPKYLKVRSNKKKNETRFSVSGRDAHDTGIENKDQLVLGMMGYLEKMTNRGVTVKEIMMSSTDLAKFNEDIEFISEKLKTVTVTDDLTLESEHYKFRNPEGHRELEAWSAENRDQRQLVHPIYYKEDFQQLEDSGLVINLTPERGKKLEVLRIEEIEKNDTAYVLPVETGYLLQVYSLRSPMFEAISEKGSVDYNKVDESGQPYKQKLRFVERCILKDDEETGGMLGQITRQGRRGYSRFEDIHTIKIENEQAITNHFAHYSSFLCRMFTLPTMISFMKAQGLTVIGAEDLYPDFEPFDFPVNRPQDHPEYRQFDFQDEATQAWVDAGHLGTIALPTGSGKTMIAIRGIELTRVKTLIVTPTIEMLHQWKNMIMKWSGIPEEKIGLYYADQKDIKDITIITFQSGHRRVRGEVGKLSEKDSKALDLIKQDIVKISEECGYIIMDEGHHAPAPIFQEIMVNVKCMFRMALTATPYRSDKNEVLAFLAMGDVVYTKDYASLAEVKAVSPMKFKRVLCWYTPEEESMIELRQKLSSGAFPRSWYTRNEPSEAETKAITQLVNMWNLNKWNRIQLAMEDKIQGINEKGIPLYINDGEYKNIQGRWLCGFNDGKFEALRKIAEKHKGDKILVFNEFVKGAKVIGWYMANELGFNAKVMTGSTGKKQRKAIFEEFKSAESIALVTTTVLDEGIDVPDCEVVVVFNASRSKRQMIQRVGRGCRYRLDKVEYVYELVAVPKDLDVTQPGEEQEGTESRYRSSRKFDDRIIEGQHERARWGSRGERYYNWRESGEVLVREFKLYDYERSMYRDIEEVINTKEQKALVEAIIGVEEEEEE